jgi:hypothetical protein
MRCQYQFSVKGRVRIELCFPISWEGFEYNFVCDENGIIRRLDVIVEVPDKQEWPTMTLNPEVGIAAHLEIKNPSFVILKKQVRAIEGLLSIYGLEAIDIEHFKQVWLPDNELEKTALGVYSFERNRHVAPAHELIPMPFDIVARLVLSAPRSRNIEIALGFHRKGRQDIREERFIEAFYDFYFMIESLFGEGKFKNSAVVGAFSNNSALTSQIEKAKQEPIFLGALSREPLQIRRAHEKYLSRTPDQILAHIVELRGYLHHHSSSRPGIWHPDDHSDYKADALFMQVLCYQIAFSISEPIVFSKKTLAEYVEVERNGRSRLQRFKLQNPDRK